MIATTRLAPSPTGALHLGNARTFLLNWLIARQRGWRVVLRIDDLDGPRLKPGADRQAIDDLTWLGIDWDEGPSRQSARAGEHAAAIGRLIDSGEAYPCVCTRREVDSAASAPHADDGSTIYPGTCRGRFRTIAEATASTFRSPAIRFAAGEGLIEFVDAFAGPQVCRPAQQLGDFVLRKSDGTPSYQLATVVDDSDSGVTHVVRGDDLLDSTPRQILLYRALGRAELVPSYMHLPLLVGEDGRRLAKRHGDTRIASIREAGVSSHALLGLLARWSGVAGVDRITPQELLSVFNPDHVPRDRVVVTSADIAKLMRLK
jgi:glutamyl-tRNA synthetase